MTKPKTVSERQVSGLFARYAELAAQVDAIGKTVADLDRVARTNETAINDVLRRLRAVERNGRQEAKTTTIEKGVTFHNVFIDDYGILSIGLRAINNQMAQEELNSLIRGTCVGRIKLSVVGGKLRVEQIELS